MFNFIYRIFNLAVFIFYLITLGADAVTNYNDLTIFGNDGCYFFGTCMCLFKGCKFWASYHKIIKLIVDVYDPIDVLIQSSGKLKKKMCRGGTEKRSIQKFKWNIVLS